MTQTPGAFEEFFDKQEYTEVNTPKNEVPVSTVPDAGEKPYDADIANMLRGTFTVAAERNVDVVTEPGAKGNMPAAPEFCDAL